MRAIFSTMMALAVISSSGQANLSLTELHLNESQESDRAALITASIGAAFLITDAIIDNNWPDSSLESKAIPATELGITFISLGVAFEIESRRSTRRARRTLTASK